MNNNSPFSPARTLARARDNLARIRWQNSLPDSHPDSPASVRRANRKWIQQKRDLWGRRVTQS